MEIPGLSSNESLVYTTLLEIKESGATKIAKKTGLFRTLVYDILNKLSEKGLVSYIKKSGKRVYKPSSPDRLLERFKEKERQTLEIIPKLKETFQEPEDEIAVEQYEGISGMKAVIEDMFKTIKEEKTKEFYFFGPRGTSMKFLGPYMLEFIKRAKKLKLDKNLDIKGIWSSDLETNKLIDAMGGQHRFFKKTEKSTSPVFIYSNKVIINGGKTKPFTIMIKNKETAESFKTYFNIIWKQAKREV